MEVSIIITIGIILLVVGLVSCVLPPLPGPPIAYVALLLAYFSFVVLVLALRYLILPNIESYRPEIERQIGHALGLAVGIGGIEASWDGLNPDLILSDVRIARVAVRIEKLERGPLRGVAIQRERARRP